MHPAISSLSLSYDINNLFLFSLSSHLLFGVLYNTFKMATKTQELLTLEGAKIAIAAAEKKAKEIGVDMNIAVVDASTHLLHFTRMEGAKITSISSMLSLFLNFLALYYSTLVRYLTFCFGVRSMRSQSLGLRISSFHSTFLLIFTFIA